jgi:hypothetical protein
MSNMRLWVYTRDFNRNLDWCLTLTFGAGYLTLHFHFSLFGSVPADCSECGTGMQHSLL